MTPRIRTRRAAGFYMRMSEEELATIRNKAAEAGAKPTDYVRRAALEKHLVHKYDQAAVRQLKRIGVNLNQAVMLMHQGNFSEEVKESFRRCLRALEIETGVDG